MEGIEELSVGCIDGFLLLVGDRACLLPAFIVLRKELSEVLWLLTLVYRSELLEDITLYR